MLAPILHILPLTTIVRERTLPVAGTVNAHMNQRVNPTDVIAEANFAREHVWFDVARTFGVSANVADKTDQSEARRPVFTRLPRCRSKRNHSAFDQGTTTGTSDGGWRGQVLMEVGDTRIELRAGMPGTVIQVLNERGVVIRTTGSLIQGIWGNGRIDNGVMTSLIEKPDEVLNPDRLDVSLRGSIILGGHVRDLETLRAAAETPVRGLIISSMVSSLLQPAMQARFPIIVLDGFGAMPMNSSAFKLLTTNNKREVTVNAEHFDRYGGNRPEVIVPLPVSNEPAEPNVYEMFAVGQQIRMRRSPHAGMIGVISGLPSGLSLLPSGLRAPAAEVKLENGEGVLVPLVNLEVVG